MKPLRCLNFLPVIFLLLTGALSAQQPLVDSIEKRLQTQLPDSVRLKDMIRLAMYYESVDAASINVEINLTQ
jgi:hypothetical protein